jgi:hypothetical protein
VLGGGAVGAVDTVDSTGGVVGGAGVVVVDAEVAGPVGGVPPSAPAPQPTSVSRVTTASAPSRRDDIGTPPLAVAQGRVRDGQGTTLMGKPTEKPSL